MKNSKAVEVITKKRRMKAETPISSMQVNFEISSKEALNKMKIFSNLKGYPKRP